MYCINWINKLDGNWIKELLFFIQFPKMSFGVNYNVTIKQNLFLQKTSFQLLDRSCGPSLCDGPDLHGQQPIQPIICVCNAAVSQAEPGLALNG